jgi:hypothetical protein
MTPQEFISAVSSSRNMSYLLDKLGGYENTQENRLTYVYPLATAAGLTMTIVNVRKTERGTLTPSVTSNIDQSSNPTN